jgi:PAS domain S-box-containing protein
MFDTTSLGSPECRATLDVLSALDEAALVLDLSGRIAWFSPAGVIGARALGVESSQVLGRAFAEVFPTVTDPALHAAIEDARQRALRSGTAPDASAVGTALEVALPHTSRRVLARVLPLPCGVALIAREGSDAGEMRRVHAAHEHRYQELFEAVPLPFVVIDRRTREIVATNGAAARAFPAHARLVGQSAAVLLAPADLEALMSAVGRSPRGHANLGVVPVHRGDGSDAEAEVEALATDFAGGPALLTIVRDVSDARHAEAERALLRGAIAHLNDLIVITRAVPSGEAVAPIVFVNEAFERHTGWQRDEVLGRPNTILDGPGTDATLVARMHEHLRRGESIRAEVLHYTKEGREYWAEMVVAPVYDPEGTITHWVSVHRDISERKRLEEQLFQAQKMEAVGRLAGGVAHDFNNVLTAISGFSELLLEELPDDGGPREEVLQIRAAAARATALTRQLLAFSRKQILRPRLVQVGALVRDVERLLQRAVTEEVNLRLRMAEFTSPVLADPVQLEQVLLNLAANASEAMPSGGTLSIEVSDVALGESYAHRHHGVQPGHYVCLTVSDTGVGMDRATRERIWEPFFTTKPGGTGLGLSTVYGIVRQSGGHVWVYSEAGTGTTFKVYLPVATGDVPVDEVDTGRSGVLGGTETILVVEDEALVRDVTHAMLQRRGYTVLVAHDGDHALRVAADHIGPIDLLLTDVVMPRANGRRVAERLQLLRPEVRVLYMSGYTEDAIVHHGVLEPGIVLLEKPFTELDLARTVRAVLDASPGGD